MFAKVLVANRGEIAVRVFRTLRELGIASVAVYSEADREAAFVAHADEAYLIGPPPAAESYLAVPRILEAARRSGAEAIHPGYGFLAENAGFARAIEAAGLVFVGPPADAIDAMGSKIAARALMEEAGVPIVPGGITPVADVAEATALAARIGYPVAVKATAGGGGKGFRVALTPEELPGAFAGASGEGERFFADPAVYLERYLPEPRHVEVQVLADAHGGCVWLGERDCSVQRRHQKLVEETPSPAVTPELRRRMGEASVRAARSVGYRSAGTLEYLVAGDDFYFLEMNTRIQVEHTVTEAVLGMDLVREQLRIAAGEPLGFGQDDIAPRGHAFECRINAEDATKRFLPSPAPITAYREPAGLGVRVDSGVRAGSDVPAIYDPMIAKLIVWDDDRESARRRMLRALAEYEVAGPVTLIPFHRWLFAREEFIAGETCHALLAGLAAEPTPLPGVEEEPSGQATEREALAERRVVAEVDGRRFDVLLRYPDPAAAGRAAVRRRRERAAADHAGSGAGGDVVAPMQGTVLRVAVEVGQRVAAGDVVCVVEAMKMENEVVARAAGVIARLDVAAGQTVAADTVVAVVEDPPDG